jgi:hypothetical protein
VTTRTEAVRDGVARALLGVTALLPVLPMVQAVIYAVLCVLPARSGR